MTNTPVICSMPFGRWLSCNPSRVRYPMVRLDRLRKREKSDRNQRGDNRFVRVSWDQALDLVYEELERVQKTYGSSGVFTARRTGKLLANFIRPAARWIGDSAYTVAM